MTLILAAAALLWLASVAPFPCVIAAAFTFSVIFCLIGGFYEGASH